LEKEKVLGICLVGRKLSGYNFHTLYSISLNYAIIVAEDIENGINNLSLRRV
jgi:hypothetical protein